MKLQILSDVHNEFEVFIPPNIDSDVVILAGDIHVKDKAINWALQYLSNTPVLYVIGNHELYGKATPYFIDKLKAQTKGTNIYLLENDMVEIDGVAFFGCTFWTDFRLFGEARVAGFEAEQKMTDFKKIRVSPKFSKLKAKDTVLFHNKSKIWLESALEKSDAKTKVVITHHAPSKQSIPIAFQNDILSSAYASNLDSWLLNLDFDLWVHGHTHEFCDYSIGDKRIVCNPRGYTDELETGFKDDLIITI